MSPTIRSSQAYDTSISSTDCESYGHGPYGYRKMSRRTFRRRKALQAAVNSTNEEEEAIVGTAESLTNLPLKSRSCSNDISKGNVHPLRSHLSAPKQGPFINSVQQPNQTAVEKNLVSGSSLKQPILNSLNSQKHGECEQSNMVDDYRCQTGQLCCHGMERGSYPFVPCPYSPQTAYSGHNHYSSCIPFHFCFRSSLCDCSIHNSFHHYLTEEVKNLSMTEKHHHAIQHCRTVSNGAPFVICSECFELLWLPLDFSILRGRANKLRCGACTKVFVLQFPAKGSTTLTNLADTANDLQDHVHSTENYDVHSFQERKLAPESGPPLHQLMGYSSATELLYQNGDANEGY